MAVRRCMNSPAFFISCSLAERGLTLPAYLIKAVSHSVTEGEALDLTVAPTGATGTALEVGVEVSETGASLADHPTTVRIARGPSAAPLPCGRATTVRAAREAKSRCC